MEEKKENSIDNLINNTKNKNKSEYKLKAIKSKEQRKEEDVFYKKILKLLQKWEYKEKSEKAIVRITISKNENFNYKFIKYSNSKKVNEELKKFLEKQKNIKYPKHPTNQSITIDVDFKPYL